MNADTQTASLSVARSKTLMLLGIVGIVFGLSLALPGLYLLSLGGSWYYVIAGILTILAGWRIFKGNAQGVTIYLGVCVLTLIWALWDVRHLQSWFWPLIPRLFAFAFALFFVLLTAPLFAAYRDDPAKKKLFRFGALAVLVGLVASLWQMFSLHGVIQNRWSAPANAGQSANIAVMGDEWHNYGRTTAGTRYVPTEQITRDNVKQLKVAWTYHTGQFGDHDSADQTTPTYANGMVYACTPYNQIHAVDGVTGKRKWMFDAKAKAPFFMRCRGVTYYDLSAPPAGNAPTPGAVPVVGTSSAASAPACTRRIAMGTVDARLISLDADTGLPCTDFGVDGTVNLLEGMAASKPGEYMQTSAPTVTNGMIIVGGLVVDNYAVGEPSGVIRAFDGRTGKLAWAWDLARPDRKGLPPEGETYTPYTPNVWSHPAVDEKRGLIFLPMGNATPDMWRKHRRPFDDEYNASVVALDVKTGTERWHFRTVNKDVWDYDLPSQPSLYDVPDPATGKMVPVLIQPTKRGQLFYLNRETGIPVAKVIERQIDTKGGAPGFEDVSKTQPYSVGMPSIGGEALTEADMWGATPIDQMMCRIKYRQLRYNGSEFVTPSTEPFLTYPGAQGGMNWGAGSIDEKRGLFIINDLRLPIITQLVPRKDVPPMDKVAGPHDPIGPQLGTPYGLQRLAFGSPLGLLCMRPPYGTISAVDLNTRKLVWQRPIGTLESLDFVGVQTGLSIEFGMPTLGGSLVTGSGLIFFGSAMDHWLRVLDAETGEEIAKLPMPVGANATPMSYVGQDGKQYIVISAGGATYAAKQYRGDYVIAYALPDRAN